MDISVFMHFLAYLHASKQIRYREDFNGVCIQYICRGHQRCTPFLSPLGGNACCEDEVYGVRRE